MTYDDACREAKKTGAVLLAFVGCGPVDAGLDAGGWHDGFLVTRHDALLPVAGPGLTVSLWRSGLRFGRTIPAADLSRRAVDEAVADLERMAAGTEAYTPADGHDPAVPPWARLG